MTGQSIENLAGAEEEFALYFHFGDLELSQYILHVATSIINGNNEFRKEIKGCNEDMIDLFEEKIIFSDNESRQKALEQCLRMVIVLEEGRYGIVLNERFDELPENERLLFRLQTQCLFETIKQLTKVALPICLSGHTEMFYDDVLKQEDIEKAKNIFDEINNKEREREIIPTEGFVISSADNNQSNEAYSAEESIQRAIARYYFLVASKQENQVLCDSGSAQVEVIKTLKAQQAEEERLWFLYSREKEKSTQKKEETTQKNSTEGKVENLGEQAILIEGGVPDEGSYQPPQSADSSLEEALEKLTGQASKLITPGKKLTRVKKSADVASDFNFVPKEKKIVFRFPTAIAPLTDYMEVLDKEKDSIMNGWGLFSFNKLQKKLATAFALSVAEGKEVSEADCMEHIEACLDGRLGIICQEHGVSAWLIAMRQSYHNRLLK